MVGLYERGGHCDFFYKRQSKSRGVTYNKEFMQKPIVAFFEAVDRADARHSDRKESD